MFAAGALIVGVPVLGYTWHEHMLASATTEPVAQAPVITEATSSKAVQTAKPPAPTAVYFNGAGQVAGVNVSLHQSVSAGQALLTIHRTDLGSQLSSAKTALASAQAKLKSLSATATTSIAVSADDANALIEAQNSVRTAVRNAYISANDVITNKAAGLFTNPASAFGKLNFSVSDTQTANALAAKMLSIENFLPGWQKQVLASSFNTATTTAAFATQAEANLNAIVPFLTSLSNAVSGALSLSQSTISSDKSMLSAAQLTISNALSAVTSAETDEAEARSAIAADAKAATASQSASAQLAIKNEQSAVAAAQKQVSSVLAEMATSTIKTSVSGTVSALNVHAGSSVTSHTVLLSITPKSK